ncbi:serine/threonine-protein kinase mos [Venturia canescens]|uniref:serine/threonine-protein kinase mos n=1 Tax=Venturia canescens TaxID=32260 RepID=UPI001C9D025E|nr:serine/threonine-protein kinase mos [Venturia canescens]
MTSPRLAVKTIKSLSPRPVGKLLNVGNLSTPRTPEQNSCTDKLKIEQPKVNARHRFSPFKVDTPNRAKILNDGLPDKEHSVLGSGYFGTVYRASYRGDQVAAKIVRRRECSDVAVNAEKHAAFLRHSNIVKVLAIEQGAVWSLITMELCGTSLQDYLEETVLPREERLATWKAISNALLFCHRAGIIHADVKPKNVLIGKDGQAKLADFGSSVIISEPKISTSLHGTPGYVAPEVIRGQSPSQASDIYSLGVLAWQLLFRKIPFAGLHAHTVLYLTGKGVRPSDIYKDDGFCGKYKSLYRKLWSEKAEDRPSLNVILERLEYLKNFT